MSNLTQDVTLNEFTQGLVIYAGNAFETSSDLYNVILAGHDFDLDYNIGSSDDLMLAVNVARGSSDGIPAGTYTVIDAPTATDFPAGTALSGFYNNIYAAYGGTWFYSPQNSIESSVRGGKVTVTNNGNDACTFDFRFEDGYGHKITGTYSGKCRVEDWS